MNKREEAFRLLKMFNNKKHTESYEQILTRNFGWSMTWVEIKRYSREFRRENNSPKGESRELSDVRRGKGST